MRARLLKPYLSFAKGAEVDFAPSIMVLLIQRGVAEQIKDPDGDGRAEGGRDGEKKAFSRPPAWTKKGKH